MSQLRRVPACLVASVTLAVCSPAVASPPEQPPAFELDEPAPGEPPPDDASLPTWTDELPADEEAAPMTEAPDGRLVAPPDGNGSLTVGAMLLGGGTILTASSLVLLFEDSPEQVGIWIAGATLGSVVIPAGMALLITGAVKRRRHEPFRIAHRPPPSGAGMLAGGSLALSAGALGMLLGGISLPRQSDDDLPYGEVLLSLGAASVATGVALTVVGAKRRRAFELWDHPPPLPTVGVLSGPQLRPAGATIGVAGRF